MSDSMLHPTPDRLEAYVEEILPDADRAVLASHLEGCDRCRAEVEEWRALFAALESLPSFAPAEGFTERVMRGVRRPLPWWARVSAAAARLVPRSTFGWVLAAALAALPVLTTGGAMAWLLTRPGLSPEALRMVLAESSWSMLGAGAKRIAEWLMTTDAALLLARALDRLSVAGAEGLLSFAAVFAALTVTSAWILYTNLIRPATRERGYASFSF